MNGGADMKKIKVAVVLFIALLMTVAAANAAEYGATYTPSNTPKCMIPSTTATVSINVANTGTLTWTPGEYFLAYHWYDGSTVVVWDGMRTALPAPVAPGNNVTLNAQIQAPDHGGNFTLKWDMVREYVTWFSWTGVPTKDESVTVSGLCSFRIDPHKYVAYRKCFPIVGCPSCPPPWASQFDLVINPSEKFKKAVEKGDAKAKRLLSLQRRVGQLAVRANTANAAWMKQIEKEAEGILAELNKMGM
jgi:hypothetical protein